MSAAPADPWTVRRLLAWTVDFFQKKAAIDSPQKEARLLLAHVLGVRPIEVIARSDDEPTDDEKARFRDLIKRRVDGTPAAYLTGTRDFYMLTFEVTPAVLIPRPDTETLVVAAVDFSKLKPGARVLDLGTGSGCVAVSLAHQNKGTTVAAVDISPAALEVARRNAARHGVADRVSFHEGDWLAAVPAGDGFDLIVSNPPYIAPDEFAALDPGVRDHEPRLALDGGPDGLTFYRRLAADGPAQLADGGRAMVEVGHTQAAAVRELFQAAGWSPGPTYKDLASIDRVVTFARPG